MSYDVQLVTVPSRHLAVVRFQARAAEVAEKIGGAFGAVEAYLSANSIQITGPAVAHFVQLDGGFSVSAGFAVTGAIEGNGQVVAMELPQTEVVTTTHMGGYDTLPQAYEAMRTYARAQGREMDEAAPMWEEYWSEPSTPPADTRTDVFWPLKPAS